MSRITARSGARTLLSLAAALGMTAALAIPASAAHTIEIDPYDETAHGCGADGGFKLEGDWLEEGTHTYNLVVGDEIVFSATLTVALDEDNEVDSIVVVSANPPAAYVLVKAGSDDPVLIGDFDTAGKAISHIEFCGELTIVVPPPPATPTEPPGGQQVVPTPTQPVTGAVLGGNPTPAAGTVPNTAMAPTSDTVPAVLLSIVLIGSLAAMAYLRLARQR